MIPQFFSQFFPALFHFGVLRSSLPLSLNLRIYGIIRASFLAISFEQCL